MLWTIAHLVKKTCSAWTWILHSLSAGEVCKNLYYFSFDYLCNAFAKWNQIVWYLIKKFHRYEFPLIQLLVGTPLLNTAFPFSLCIFVYNFSFVKNWEFFFKFMFVAFEIFGLLSAGYYYLWVHYLGYFAPMPFNYYFMCSGTLTVTLPLLWARYELMVGKFGPEISQARWTPGIQDLVQGGSGASRKPLLVLPKIAKKSRFCVFMLSIQSNEILCFYVIHSIKWNFGLLRLAT